jgi:multidrug transporter EmrE-like cation transporter
MVSYVEGIAFGILAGMLNFLGQVLEKKAINDTPPEQRDKGLVKRLVRNRTWILGIICVIGFSTVFNLLGQATIGGTLMPGLGASGFIILAIGSVKILKESLKFFEIVAIILLMVAITLIGFSKLSIVGSLTYFTNGAFNVRLAFFTIGFTALWLGFFYPGRKAKKYKSILLALGTGFPFVVGNIWLQPFIISFATVLGGNASLSDWIIFLIAALITVFANLFGLGHYQYALNAGNASIVVPVQQIPQQIGPILIYFLIYQFAPPTAYSIYLLSVGIVLICIAGFFLGKRQATLERIKT